MKNRKGIYMLYIVCVVSVMLSCENKNKDLKFFDIPAFFKQEIEIIKTSNYVVTKSYSYNGEGSKMDMKASDINWEKEFAIFLECDINKPAYFANMEILHAPYDSIESSVVYLSRSKKLNIQSVKIESIHGETSTISIKINKSNLISTTSIDAYYYKGTSYSIYGIQTIKKLGEKNDFWVEGRFYR